MSPALKWWKKPWIGYKWLFHRTGEASTNHFEAGGFIRSNNKEKYPNHTIEDYLQTKKYSEYFKYNHLYPMAASIWSSSLDSIKGYPFSRFIDFFSNHGKIQSN